MFELHHGDCLDEMAKMPENSVDSIVTDPPYGLSFMGKDWDHGVPGEHFWKEALRVAKPGAYLLAFGGTRTFHRLAVAIEDAGWEIRDTLMWVYGSGFPKSLDISKAIDKEAGAIRSIGPIDPNRAGRLVNQKQKYITESGWSAGNRKITIDSPATDGAKEWDGWGTALKPAWEPIIMARKSLSESTVAKNVLKWGTGGINIDGCRVKTDEDITNHSRSAESAISKGKYGDSVGQETHQTDGQKLGRFPANLIHDGSEEVVSVFPNALGQQGESLEDGEGRENRIYGKMKRGGPKHVPRNEENKNAARFFYCAKASRKERGEYNKHPTVKPLELMKYLCNLVTPKNGIVLDPFMGSGSTGLAALQEEFNFIGIELEKEYIDIANKRMNTVSSKPKLEKLF